MVVAEGMVRQCVAASELFQRAKDFKDARAKAGRTVLLGRLTGRKVELLPLEEVQRWEHVDAAYYNETILPP